MFLEIIIKNGGILFMAGYTFIIEGNEDLYKYASAYYGGADLDGDYGLYPEFDNYLELLNEDE